MWRRILGIVVGWFAGGFAATILFIVFFMVMKKDGMLESDGTMTTVWMVIALALGAATSYLAGVIARMIGKDKLTTLIFLGLTLLYGIYSLVMQQIKGTPEMPEVQEGTPQWMLDWIDVGMSVALAPIWFTILSLLLNLGGLALGGFNKGDFDKPAPTEQPGT